MINSGESVGLKQGEYAEFETLTERFNDDKHHHWNSALDIFKLKQGFTIRPSEDDHTAVYQELNPASLNCVLMPDFSGSQKSIDFKDPWYVDQNGDQPDDFMTISDFPYSITGHYNESKGGVFKNQDPNVTPIYYQISAETTKDLTAHGETVTYNFMEWQTNSACILTTPMNIENGYYKSPLIFTGSGAEARAVYKGHGVSNNARATGHNNGRRIATIPGSDYFHMVYEDEGKIYYSTSSGGQTWAKEELISDEDLIAKNPTIEAFCHGIMIVYETYEIDEVNGIAWRRIESCGKFMSSEWGSAGGYLDYNSEWVETSYPLQEDEEARPAIVRHHSTGTSGLHLLFCVWREKTGPGQYKFYTNESYDGGWNNDKTYLCTVTDGFPSLCQWKGNPVYVWTENGQLKFKCGTGTVYTIDMPSSSYGTIYNAKRPSIVSDYRVNPDNYCRIAFEARMDHFMFGPNVPVLYYAYFDVTQSNPTLLGATIASQGGTNENISFNPSISYDGTSINIFENPRGVVSKSTKQGTSWVGTYYDNNSHYPSVCRDYSTGAVWTRYNEAPYFLRTDMGDGSLNKSVSNTITLKQVKEFFYPLMEKNAEGKPKLFSMRLKAFNINGVDMQFDDSLKTKKILLPKQNNIEMLWAAGTESIPDNLTLMRIYYQTTRGKYLVKTITSDDMLKDYNDEVQAVMQTLGYKVFDNIEGYFLIEFDENNPFVLNVLLENDANSVIAKTNSDEMQQVEIIPEYFSLRQNFPNPFNPVTQIAYDLPQACEIHLAVYDIAGRLVSVLDKGYKAAGQYQVWFDGSHLASGVYIYQMITPTFSETKRMLLVK